MKKQITYLPIGILASATLISGAALTMGGASALTAATCTTDSNTGIRTCQANGASASVTVTDGACQFTSADQVTAMTMEAGVTANTEAIASRTPMTISCNDAGGFDLYAIGNSPATAGGVATEGQTHLISSTGEIATGTDTGGSTSSWSFKVTSATLSASAQTPAYGTLTVTNGYSSYTTIPDEYVKIVTVNGTINQSNSATIRTDYRVYTSSTQPSGTYTGGVKYQLVNPSGTPLTSGS